MVESENKKNPQREKSQADLNKLIKNRANLFIKNCFAFIKKSNFFLAQILQI